jgi:hypothetical protein
MHLTLAEWIWREIHTSHEGEYDGVKRSVINRETIDRLFQTPMTLNVTHGTVRGVTFDIHLEPEGTDDV